jgi:hypothetical protein
MIENEEKNEREIEWALGKELNLQLNQRVK